jgi:hypothetical protein
MIALCDNVQNVVMPIPTFFIPSRLNGRPFSGLPLSKDLSLAIKKLSIKSLGDLNGISQKDFQSVSSKSSALFVELLELIQKLRDDQLPPDSSDKSLEPVNHPVIKPIEKSLPEIIQQSTAIVIPEELRGHLLSTFPMSVRLKNVLEFKCSVETIGDCIGSANAGGCKPAL